VKYFTRERHLALQATDRALADQADAAWEEAAARYEAYLESIRPGLPEAVLALLDGYDLHDARVLTMGQRGQEFVVSLQLDIPPRDVLTLTYRLAGPPVIRKLSFPSGGEKALWLYDEIERTATNPPSFVHAILLSNGWEVAVPFHDIATTTLTAVYPVTAPLPAAAPSTASGSPASSP